MATQNVRSAQSVQKRVTVSLEEDQFIGLEEFAQDTGKSLADAARDAINHYLLGQHWKDTIGSTARKAIEARLSNQEVLEQVLKKFPYARTSPASIAWYRSQLRKEGKDVPTDAQAKHERGIEDD